jgi:hypothetical protein
MIESSGRAFLGRLAGLALLGTAQLVGGVALLLPAVDPAAAQLFERRSQGGFFFPFFDQRPRREYEQRPRREYQHSGPAASAPADFSRAPPPKKSDTTPTTTVVVMGDSLSDWLAYGLEDALADSPEIGVVRKHRTYSGLIRYDGRQEWPQVAREILAADKPDVVVMMLGLSDRQPIRERAAAPPAARPGQRSGQAAQAQPAQQDQAQQPADAADDAPDAPDQPAATTQRPGSGASHEYRSEKWAEAYAKKIDETIAALQSTGAQVLWVGLPSIRGAKSTSDVIYLNNLFRSQAQKAGIVYVDVWDGFVDEAGRYTYQGPDVEGQVRRLRTADGVHFTRFGARKLAHYVEREIRRAMSVRGQPVAVTIPTDPTLPPGAAPPPPSGPAARPLAGPVLPLTATVTAADELMGGPNMRPAGGDPVATKVLVRGEPMAAPAGRADDFAWPRRAPELAGPGPVTVPEPATASVDPAARRPAQAAPGGEAARPRPAEPRRVARPQPPEPRQQQQRQPSLFPDGLIPFFRSVR